MERSTIVKKEQVVKIEGPVEQEVTTVVLQNISEFGEVQHQIVSSGNIPHLLKSYEGTQADGSVQIVQLEDGQYTYIIE